MKISKFYEQTLVMWLWPFLWIKKILSKTVKSRIKWTEKKIHKNVILPEERFNLVMWAWKKGKKCQFGTHHFNYYLILYYIVTFIFFIIFIINTVLLIVQSHFFFAFWYMLIKINGILSYVFKHCNIKRVCWSNES